MAVEVEVDVRVADGGSVGVTVTVRVCEGIAVGVRLAIGKVNEAVKLPSGAKLGVAKSVGVEDGIDVALGDAVEMGITIGSAVGGKNWFATGSPNKADTTVEENKTSANASHCQPASV